MATLALKDAGIEVVAVGNGEAAVRKIMEVSPDLVLADIFMPVRNGYEVCEFVKRDPKYSNIPVLLLAGAFDPFDEAEAQRVQADGILKKPFVPPDPLINAVKTLLEKSAGERLMAVTVPVEGEASATSAKSATPTAPAPSPVSATVAPALPHPPEEPADDDAGLHAGAEAHAFVDFGASAKSDKGLFYSSSPTTETSATDEPEPVVTASRDPVLGEPAFWAPEQDESAEAEEDAAEDLTDHSWGSSTRSAPMRDDPDPPAIMVAEPGADDDHLGHFAGVLEPAPAWDAPTPVPPATEPAVPAVVPAAAISTPPANSHSAEETLRHASAEDTAPLPQALPPAPPELAPHDSSSLHDSSVHQPSVQAPSVHELEAWAAKLPGIMTAEVSEKPAGAETPLAATGAAATLDPYATGDDDSPLLELEDTLQALPEWAEIAAAPAAPAPLAAPASKQESAAPPSAAEPKISADWPPVFVPVPEHVPAVNETHPSAFDLSPAHSTAPSIERDNAPERATEPEQTPAADQAPAVHLTPEAQEALIQRVIERLQPQIVEMVSRQILRPLVESLVHSELAEK